MATLAYVDHLALVQLGTHVAALLGHRGERLQAVDAGHGGGIVQNDTQVLRYEAYQLVVYLLFELQDAVLCPEDLLLILL